MCVLTLTFLVIFNIRNCSILSKLSCLIFIFRRLNLIKLGLWVFVSCSLDFHIVVNLSIRLCSFVLRKCIYLGKELRVSKIIKSIFLNFINAWDIISSLRLAFADLHFSGLRFYSMDCHFGWKEDFLFVRIVFRFSRLWFYYQCWLGFMDSF